MGRPRRTIDVRSEGPELLRRFKEEKPGWKRERLLAIKRVLEDASTLTVAQEIGRSEGTIQSWINKFRRGGIEELLTKKKGNGPASRLTPEMEEAITRKIRPYWKEAEKVISLICKGYLLSELNVIEKNKLPLNNC